MGLATSTNQMIFFDENRAPSTRCVRTPYELLDRPPWDRKNRVRFPVGKYQKWLPALALKVAWILLRPMHRFQVKL